MKQKKKILIFGAGSIGTHHANAAVSLNCDVYVTDISNTQLKNMKFNIYPSRYGKWNKNINFIDYKNVFKQKKNFDLIILGVPPKFHLELLKLCEKKINFKKILVEKPLCVYNQNFTFLKNKKISNKIYCGFNHSISKSFLFFLKKLNTIENANLKIDVLWKESFKLVMKAHPWIESIDKSYLSNIKEGGGVSHEYSHAIHLFLIIKSIIFKDSKTIFYKKIQYENKKNRRFDNLIKLKIKKNNKELNLTITSKNTPTIKKINVFENKIKKLTWDRKLEKEKEIVYSNFRLKKNKVFRITRRQDFINELQIILFKKHQFDSLKYIKFGYAAEVMYLLKKIFTKKNV